MFSGMLLFIYSLILMLVGLISVSKWCQYCKLEWIWIGSIKRRHLTIKIRVYPADVNCLQLSRKWLDLNHTWRKLDLWRVKSYGGEALIAVFAIICCMLWWPPYINLTETSKMLSLVTLGCTRSPKGIWPLAHNEGNHRLQSLNFVDNWPIFTIESSHPNTLSFRKNSHYKNISGFS